jgi:hypothetical protein
VGRLATLLVALCLAAGPLTACRSRTLTTARLEPAFAATFANLVSVEEGRLGLPPVAAAALGATATCRRVGPGTATSGSGQWVCTVSWSGPGRGARALRDTFELEVTVDGCFTASADGAEAHVGGPTLTVKSGAVEPNLVYAFDGCFDPT